MATTHDNGGPAFPAMGNDMSGHGMIGHVPGMTLLDYFAGQALSGLMAYPGDDRRGSWNNNASDECVASKAYELAATMLAEKERRKAVRDA